MKRHNDDEGRRVKSVYGEIRAGTLGREDESVGSNDLGAGGRSESDSLSGDDAIS